MNRDGEMGGRGKCGQEDGREVARRVGGDGGERSWRWIEERGAGAGNQRGRGPYTAEFLFTFVTHLVGRLPRKGTIAGVGAPHET